MQENIYQKKKKHTLESERIIRYGEEKCWLLFSGQNNNHFDNSLENLQILCPNCHAIQEGNSGKNIGNYN